MARRPRTLAEIDTEIEALKQQRQKALDQRSALIGKLAAKAGLVELDVPDAELLKEFGAIADRLRNRSGPNAKTATAAKSAGNGSPSAANPSSGS
ncbi:TraC family protein [Nitratireductor sp. XY-223]|uniref:TraC family protein n=1 Tax=Nitratireductor sp. XY-223 TaxID=2561926 RepID=UPI0010AAD7AF|nr:TraC family protein [Nitratireductor sp. XY-223]